MLILFNVEEFLPLSFHFSVPCIVLAAQYKLTPTFLPESKRLEASCLVSPGMTIDQHAFC